MKDIETNLKNQENIRVNQKNKATTSYVNKIVPAGIISLSVATLAFCATITGSAIHGVLRGEQILSSKDPGADLIKLYENPPFIQKFFFNILADESMRALATDKEKFREAFLHIVQENRFKIAEKITEAIGSIDFNRRIYFNLKPSKTPYIKEVKISEYQEIFQEAKELANKQNNYQIVGLLEEKIAALETKRINFQNLLEKSVEQLWNYHNTAERSIPFKHEYVELPKEHWTDKEIKQFVESQQFAKLKQIINEPKSLKPLTQKNLENSNKKHISR
jgi:hypothetical protein